MNICCWEIETFFIISAISTSSIRKQLDVQNVSNDD